MTTGNRRNAQSRTPMCWRGFVALAAALVAGQAAAQTKMFERTDSSSVSGYLVADTSPGVATTATQVTTTSGTWIPFPVKWISSSLATQNLASGSTFTCNGWGFESVPGVNASLGCRIFRRTAAGTEEGTAFCIAANATELSGAPPQLRQATCTLSAAKAFADGDRIVVYWGAVNAGIMGAGSVTLDYGGTTGGSDGDTFATSSVNLTFLNDGDATPSSTRPVISIVNPGKNAVVKSPIRVQARVYSKTDLTAVNILVDGTSYTMSRIAAYGGVANQSGVWERQLSTSELTAGFHTLRATAQNASGLVYSGTVGVTVHSTGVGDANLVIRDNASMVCTDCHNLATHSSEQTGNKWGSWANTCRDCHTPHATTNIFLVSKQITPPALNGQPPTRSVSFLNRTGYAASSYASSSNNGPCQVCHTRTAYYKSDGSGGSHDQTQCTSCHKHTKGFGGACADCHVAATGANTRDDVDNWEYGVIPKVTAKIDGDDWRAYGHGRRTVVDGAYAQSGNPPANFDSQDGTRNGCMYCHTSDASHGLSTNPFRLANVTETTQNHVCTICHSPSAGETGYDPGSGLIVASAATKTIDSYHYGGDHTGVIYGGAFCWDCHDPHGDYNFNQSKVLAYMFQEYPTINSSGPSGVAGNWGIPTSNAIYVNYYDATDGTAGWHIRTDYYVTSTVNIPVLGARYNGVCQVCHTGASYFKNNVAPVATHNDPNGCMGCHKHQQDAGMKNQAFRGEGKCVTCHANTAGSIPRAKIVGAAALGEAGDDFMRKSRHVSNGGTTPIVTDYDCILCHAEGDLTSSGTGATAIIKTVAANHGGDSGSTLIELRNVDSSGGTGIMVAWPGKRNDTYSATTADRDRMDSFCMGCHDGDGASAVAVTSADDGMLTATFPTSTSMSRSASTVTVTTAAAHGLVVGDAVYQPIPETGLPSGWKTVASVSGLQFTYTETGSATASSSLLRTWKRFVRTAANGLSRPSGSTTVTVTTPYAHGFTGTLNLVMSPGELNKDNSSNYVFSPGLKSVTVTSTTTFTYAETTPNPLVATTSTIAQRFSVPGVSRALRPFNTADTAQNAFEVDTELRTYRNGRDVVNVKDQFNSTNALGKSWASHHNLNQFIGRYDPVAGGACSRSTTDWPLAAWVATTTKEGKTLNSTTDTTASYCAKLHCSDCHLNEVNTHGSSNTPYMLVDYLGTDTAFANPQQASNGTDNCFRCHNRAAYGDGNTDSNSSRTDYHAVNNGRCQNWDYLAAKGGATLGADTQIVDKGGSSVLGCLTCHGGNSLGGIHGSNHTYEPGDTTPDGTGETKNYRFMGTGGSMRYYSPTGAAFTTNPPTSDTNWEGTNVSGCYTISAVDSFGGCTQHGSFGSATGTNNRARPLQY